MQVAANDFIQSSRPTTPDTDYQDPPSNLPEAGHHLLHFAWLGASATYGSSTSSTAIYTQGLVQHSLLRTKCGCVILVAALCCHHVISPF